jgi:periplasmic protein CpxP/Spy
MTRTLVAGLVLALTFGGASVSNAQHSEHGRRDGKNGHVAYLLKGIELTDAQKEQLKALRQTHRPEGADKAAMEKKHEQVKAARERGDTAALRALRSEFHGQMKERHEAMLTSMRSILTPAQREIFEKNLAEGRDRMKQHMDGKRGRGQHQGEHKS